MTQVIDNPLSDQGEPPSKDTDDDNRMVHWTCRMCPPHMSLCGKPTTRTVDMPVDCVVCEELKKTHHFSHL